MSRRQRWHDKRPETAKAVHFLGSLPKDLQTIIGEATIEIANKEFKAQEVIEESFKSIGSDKIMGLHQSKKKRRAYDENPTLHKAITCIYVLKEEQQIWLSNRLLVLMDYVMKYYQLHKEVGMAAQAATLKELTHAFVHGGAGQADKVIHKVKNQLSLHYVAIGEDVLKEGQIVKKKGEPFTSKE